MIFYKFLEKRERSGKIVCRFVPGLERAFHGGDSRAPAPSSLTEKRLQRETAQKAGYRSTFDEILSMGAGKRRSAR
jgi:hypothetical protein